MKQVYFFAFRDDLVPVLDAVERTGRLKYIRTGHFPTPRQETFNSGAEIPELGRSKTHQHLGDEFLVTAQDVSIESRQIGTTGRYVIDQLVNPDTITFSPGGTWGDDVLLSGRVATVDDSGLAQELMKRFKSAIGKQFTKIQAFWVGPRAADFLRAGGRLTQSALSPREFDLKMPG